MPKRSTLSDSDRFDTFVYPDPNSGCFLWSGTGLSGYGLFRVRRQMVRAHRFAWERAFGTIPKGLHVCHKCDTRSCVNPDHLFLGTDGDNMKDMARKGRARRALPLGVYRRRSLYRVGLSEGNKMRWFGTYDLAEATAVAARERIRLFGPTRGI